MEELLMILSWAIFYPLNTLLASSKLKRILEGKWPIFKKKYRLFYSVLFSSLLMGILIEAIFFPYLKIFPTTPFLNYLGYMLAAIGVIIAPKPRKKFHFPPFLVLELVPMKFQINWLFHLTQANFTINSSFESVGIKRFPADLHR